MNEQPSQLRVYLFYANASRELREFVERLKNDLQAHGISVWMAENLRLDENSIEAIGRAIQDIEAIGRAIQDTDVMLLITSPGVKISHHAEYALSLAMSSQRRVVPVVIGRKDETEPLSSQIHPMVAPFNALDAREMDYDKALASILQFLTAIRATGSNPENREVSILRIRITEEPLTAYNLSTIISALTELSTKYWLIARRRFAELIEYTQTHNGRFAEEANLIITKISHNSPADISLSFPNFDPEKVANALVTTIDGITQVPKRLKQKELEIQAKAQEIQHTEQQADHEKQMAALEQEQRRLEIEKQRLEVLEKQLEVQRKGIEYALEIAGKVVDLLHHGADPATRAMEIQALLPNLVQLQNGKGLELALPVSQTEKPTTSNEDT